MNNKFIDKYIKEMTSTDKILGQIGNTPLLSLNSEKWGLKDIDVYAKAEWFNPGGSVKDRPALRMILDGIRSGRLTEDKTILDSTSGNTGIAYAMIGRALEYKVKLVMPQNVSLERRHLVRAYGAQAILTDPLQGSDGAIREAKRLGAEEPDKYFMPDQYNNSSNWKAHYDTTAIEIIKQTHGKLTHFIAGIGTSGTLMGTGRRLKEFNRNIKVIAVEPNSPVHGLEGLKHMATSIVPGIYDESFLDGKIQVDTENSYDVVKEMLIKEGLLVGFSSGAAMKGVLELSKSLKRAVIVTIFPDSGDRYLSMSLWEECEKLRT